MADLNSIGGIHYEMMRRCYNQKSVAYKDYGAKGIIVCTEWHDRENFKQWAKTHGYKKGLRLNRKDSSKNYDPENCFFGEVSKAKHGNNEMIKNRAIENKIRKANLGLKNLGDSRLPHILANIIDRCYNPNCSSYKNYGGRGIKVCDEWLGKNGRYNFIKWALDSGWKECDDYKLQTVDRKNTDGDYCPENCEFIYLKEQQKNKRNNIKYEYNGKVLNISEIAKIENIKYNMLYNRIKNKGMGINDAINDCKIHNIFEKNI